MQPLQLSSGDLVADRRASYAEMLLDAGDWAAAVDLMRETLSLVPQWTAGRFRLGEMLEKAGRIGEAVDAWREVVRLDPEDRMGATLKLSLAGFADGIDAPPAGFVEALFDQYAPEFDGSLLEKLEYRVPELLVSAIQRAEGRPFAHALDLGCGTGLMGERLARLASFLEGVDISANMLKRAEAKQIYGRLAKADLNLMEFPAGPDLVTAADVFMYVGAMDAVLPRIAGSLSTGGIFGFSVELHAGEEDFVLRPSRRYAHSESYLCRLLAADGFDVVSLERAAIRTDRGEPVEGLIVVARKGLQPNEQLLHHALKPGPAGGLRNVGENR
ncbi:MAG TPA: methyltransferase domain-containing protein [Erythrobacter sp.]|nr:methyltransferase domain-containing protein [Erythrobacter sp.]